MNSEAWIILGIALCLSQSGIFSGLNIGLFSLGRIRLEAAASSGSKEAAKILHLRERSHLLLATILWGNVGANVLLTILSDSLLAGVGAFFFSTFLITLLGEIFPQAYFTRNALKIGSLLSPLMKFYMVLLYPIAKPTSILLDKLLGEEEYAFFKETDLHFILKKHADTEGTDIGEAEGLGAINFLHLDDIPVSREGSVIDPLSIISLPSKDGVILFPEISSDDDEEEEDPFIEQVNASGKPWVIITDEQGDCKFALDADGLMRDHLAGEQRRPYFHCHRPILVRDRNTTLDDIISKFHVDKTHAEDDVIDDDIIIYWGTDEKRIITGADLLGRLLRGIVETRQE
jgi:metal transporter CNNM